jgi:hypothetical protein
LQQIDEYEDTIADKEIQIDIQKSDNMVLIEKIEALEKELAERRGGKS